MQKRKKLKLSFENKKCNITATTYNEKVIATAESVPYFVTKTINLRLLLPLLRLRLAISSQC